MTDRADGRRCTIRSTDAPTGTVLAAPVLVALLNELAFGNLLDHFSLGYVIIKFLAVPAITLTIAAHAIAHIGRRGSDSTKMSPLWAISIAAAYIGAIIIWPLPWLYVENPDWAPVAGWAGVTVTCVTVLGGGWCLLRRSGEAPGGTGR